MRNNTKFSDKDLFTLLVQQLSTSAWTHLGKNANPLTGKAQRNLEAAAMSIDILEMLLFKTSGNLSKSEDKLITESLRELRHCLLEEQRLDQSQKL